MSKWNIKTTKDVEDFLRYIHHDMKTAFHPDFDFSRYVDSATGKKAFTDEEITEFNAVLDECFKVCKQEGEDIYVINFVASCDNQVH